MALVETKPGRPPESLFCKLRGLNELDAEGGGLFFKVAAAAGEVLWGDVEGFGFVVGLLTLNHAIEDADEFVGGGDEAFGFAGPSL